MNVLLVCLSALTLVACANHTSPIERCRDHPTFIESPYLDLAFSCSTSTGGGTFPGCERRDTKVIELRSEPNGRVLARYVQGRGVPVRLIHPELKDQLPWADYQTQIWVEIETICGERGWVPWMTLNSVIIVD